MQTLEEMILIAALSSDTAKVNELLGQMLTNERAALLRALNLIITEDERHDA